MPRITKVDALDRQTLGIELSNHNVILLNLRQLQRQTPALQNWEAITWPETDGQVIYWPNGPRLSLADIITCLRQPGGQA